jgi:hypothetical protein
MISFVLGYDLLEGADPPFPGRHAAGEACRVAWLADGPGLHLAPSLLGTGWLFGCHVDCSREDRDAKWPLHAELDSEGVTSGWTIRHVRTAVTSRQSANHRRNERADAYQVPDEPEKCT